MKKLLLLFTLFATAYVCRAQTNPALSVYGLKMVDRAGVDTTNTANVGKIVFDAADDKFRFNNGSGWYSFLREGVTLPYWKTSGFTFLNDITQITLPFDLSGDADSLSIRSEATLGPAAFSTWFVDETNLLYYLRLGVDLNAPVARYLKFNADYIGAEGTVFFHEVGGTKTGIQYYDYDSTAWTNSTLATKGYVDGKFASTGAYWPLSGTGGITESSTIQFGASSLATMYVATDTFAIDFGVLGGHSGPRLSFASQGFSSEPAGHVSIGTANKLGEDSVRLSFESYLEDSRAVFYDWRDEGKRGIEYSQYDSTEWTDSTLVTKAYVDGVFAGTGTYWPLSGSGTTTGDVTIDGNNDLTFDNNSWTFGSRTSGTGNNSMSVGDDHVMPAANSFASGYGHTINNGSGTALGTANTVSGDHSIATGWQTTASGSASFSAGRLTIASGGTSMATGGETRATGLNSWAGGRGLTSGSRFLFASGTTSFNFSENTVDQIAGHGALANNSAILGGTNHNIEAGNVRAAIIGGNGIKLTGTNYIDHVAVPNLAIFSTPGDGGTDDFLTWNATSKKVGKVAQSSLPFWPLSGTASLTDDVEITSEDSLKLSPQVLMTTGQYSFVWDTTTVANNSSEVLTKDFFENFAEGMTSGYKVTAVIKITCIGVGFTQALGYYASEKVYTVRRSYNGTLAIVDSETIYQHNADEQPVDHVLTVNGTGDSDDVLDLTISIGAVSNGMQFVTRVEVTYHAVHYEI